MEWSAFVFWCTMNRWPYFDKYFNEYYGAFLIVMCFTIYKMCRSWSLSEKRPLLVAEYAVKLAQQGVCVHEVSKV